MITTNEINIANNSYLKKDFYQIYPEILDIVSKITERWDPASSNESDPGVVLLKLLAFIADKNNYNIDKNILECFMPSCTQTESMRKLCEMLGYEMQYYNSATTTVTFMYQGSSLKEGDQIKIPQFTVITNEDKDINLPIRKTKNSVGYDLEAAEETIIPSIWKGRGKSIVNFGINIRMKLYKLFSHLPS